MPAYICETCGTQFAPGESPPDACPICLDERQFVGWEGQTWTTLAELRSGHRCRVEAVAPGLTGLGIEPAFGIGQRALLVRSPGGNVLWDCISLVDEAVVQEVRELGGIAAIAISHPHYYSAMVEWSEAFGGVPIHLHAADREWVMRPDPAIRWWEGDRLDLHDGMTLVRCGGHFEGGAALHWPAGAAGRGALLTGDVLQVTMDRRHVSFMYSFPNYIPLSAAVVRRIGESVDDLAFEEVWGAWWGRRIASDGNEAVRRSVERYVEALAGS
jgi:hypothetical protein